MVQAYFNDQIQAAICGYLHEADSCLVCAAWLTNQQILDALSLIDTKIIVGFTPRLCGTQPMFDPAYYRRLKESCCQLNMYPSTDNYILHHKFIVLFRDEKPYAVLTGSYNFTEQGNRNLENIVYLENASIAQQYADEWHLLYTKTRCLHRQRF